MAKFDWEKHNLNRRTHYRNTYKLRKVTGDTLLWFGKYRGVEVREVMEKNPKYIEWCKNKKILI